jgi:hypothetical protein
MIHLCDNIEIQLLLNRICRRDATVLPELITERRQLVLSYGGIVTRIWESSVNWAFKSLL